MIKVVIKKIVPKKLLKLVRNRRNTDHAVNLFFGNSTSSFDHKSNKIYGLMPVYYWDGKPNFGDLVGPYLISKITKKPVVNIKNLPCAGIMAVGSIIQMLDRKNMIIWGSGLMHEPTKEQEKKLIKYKPEVLSVRGRETAKCLIELGISVPDESTYGDPAVLLPLFYKPSIKNKKKIGICPHYTHKPYFRKEIDENDNLKIIDVQDDLETVVDAIFSSTVCISTSLHGLIIAQAYNIPWIWLEIVDNNLGGDDFKFNDFFSTIDKSQVAHVKIKMSEVKDIDYKILAKDARLPNKLYNEELILNSLKQYLNR